MCLNKIPDWNCSHPEYFQKKHQFYLKTKEPTEKWLGKKKLLLMWVNEPFDKERVSDHSGKPVGELSSECRTTL